MAKYKFRYWYEWGAGGDCLWAANDATRDKFGCNPRICDLQLSEMLADFLNETGIMHDDALNWEYPPVPPQPSGQRKRKRNLNDVHKKAMTVSVQNLERILKSNMLCNKKLTTDDEGLSFTHTFHHY